MGDMSRAVVLSGCSGGGKSTVLEQLRLRGFATVDEPGRRVVREELSSGGEALPWIDAEAFAQRCIDVGRADIDSHHAGRWVFFDRSLVDAATALHHHTGKWGCSISELQCYHQRVFLTPPWRELYAVDHERQLGFEDAVAEYDRLLGAYRVLDYTVTVLPRIDVDSRVDIIVNELSAL